MNCKKCGNQINVGDLVCSNCGEPVAVDAVNSNVGQVVQPNVGVQPEQPNLGVQPGVVEPQPINMQQDIGVQPNVVQPNVGVQPVAPGVMDQPAMQQPNQQVMPGVVNQQQAFEQQMVQQPGVQQPVQDASAVTTPKKSGGGKVFIVIIILCLAVIGVLVWMLFFNKQGAGSVGGTTTTPSTVTPDTNSGDSETVTTANNTQVEVSGYKVTVPTGLKYAMNEGWLVVADTTGGLAAILNFVEDNYDNYKNNPNLLVDEMKKEGVEATFSTKTYNNREYLIYRFYVDSEKIYVDFIISKVSDKDLACGYIYEYSTYNEATAFGYITQIINSVQGEGSTSKFSFELPKTESSEDFLKKVE